MSLVMVPPRVRVRVWVRVRVGVRVRVRVRVRAPGRTAEVERASHVRLGPLALERERGGGLVEHGRPHPRALLRAPAQG